MKQNSDLVHKLRQPLNIISLTAANMRIRLQGKPEGEDQAYLMGKLERIEQQLERARMTLEEFEAQAKGAAEEQPSST